MFAVRVTSLATEAPDQVPPWPVSPETGSRHLRRQLVGAVRRHREAERTAGLYAWPLTLEFAPVGADDWYPVLCAGGERPVTIDSLFSADWSALTERLQLALRHWQARRRLRERTAARRRKGPPSTDVRPD